MPKQPIAAIREIRGEVESLLSGATTSEKSAQTIPTEGEKRPGPTTESPQSPKMAPARPNEVFGGNLADTESPVAVPKTEKLRNQVRKYLK